MQNLKPKKYLGQHFLTDLSVAQKIVGLLSAPPSATVIEIGPGQGVLTAFLFEKYPSLKLLEVDPEAVTYIQTQFAKYSPDIIHQDVLKWNPAENLDAETYFISNLPYNISSPFFFLMLENLAQVKEGVFMIQKEVAERICAGKGSKTYGILSVLLGAYFNLKYEFSVPPHVFRPPPKVMSGVIRMVKKEVLPDVDFPQFKQLVKAAFNQRRKTLRNALKGIELNDFPEKEEWLSLRAEQLSVDDFVRLAREMR
ncbi:MAG: 16S rRNA (adenine(1518)-N(6)/adenine(1519)-N(6))-dimethyltransferase RsmA [Bacteroidia bacterium]